MGDKKEVFKRSVKQIFLDTKGKPSSKRIITFIAFFLMCVAFIVNLMFKIPMEEFIYEGMLFVVAGGLGFTALEHFSPGASNNQTANQSNSITVGVENPELLEG